MLYYRAVLPLSRQTLTFVSGLLRAHRREIGSPWRKLNTGQQALLVLVYLRKGEPFAEVGAGFAVSTTTCWRYVNETVELLAARAPTLRTALRKAKREGMAYVIIDGTLIPIDRIVAALVHKIGTVIGQNAVDDKTNEIPTVRDLLRRMVTAGIDLAGAVITVDAMHTQTETARLIRTLGADLRDVRQKSCHMAR